MVRILLTTQDANLVARGKVGQLNPPATREEFVFVRCDDAAPTPKTYFVQILFGIPLRSRRHRRNDATVFPGVNLSSLKFADLHTPMRRINQRVGMNAAAPAMRALVSRWLQKRQENPSRLDL